jgi:citronellol/citronellal dehydrogenase
MAERYSSIFRADLFRGSVVLITGGGTGIGRCTAHELAELGATVVLAGRRREILEATAAEITGNGGSCDVAEINIRDESSVDAAVAGIVQRHGKIDGLFNNAGGQFVAPAADMSPNGWRTVIDLNLTGTFLVSHAVYRHCMQANGGAIVSMLADIRTGYPGMAHSAAARAGIENLTKTLTLEWAEADIRVNCIAPGMILSSGMLTYPTDVQETSTRSIKQSPAGRPGTESEVSAAVAFLLSPAAAYVRGATLHIDGGEGLQKQERLLPFSHPSGIRAYNGFHLATDFSGTPLAEVAPD